jgi:hypothetical protein
MDRKIKGTRALTVSAVLCALGVILLALGALLQVLDITMAALASFLVIFAVIELGGKYPFLIYAVTALLSMLLVPYKTAPLMYLCFAGYYPLLKAVLEGRMLKIWAWVLKLLAFNVALALTVFLAVKIFAAFVVPAVWYYFLLPVCSVVFVIYDIALTRVITAYLTRWRHRFRFLHK